MAKKKPERAALLLATMATFDNPDADAPVLYLVVAIDEERARALLSLRTLVAASEKAAKEAGLEFLRTRFEDKQFRVFAECPWPEEEGGDLEGGWFEVKHEDLGSAEETTGGSLYVESAGLTWAFGYEDYNDWGSYENDNVLPWATLREYLAGGKTRATSQKR